MGNLPKFLVLITLIILIDSTVWTMEDCRRLCKCSLSRRMTKVICKGGRVKKVPSNLPKNVTDIYLSGTAITRVRKGDFTKYPKLKQIFFRDLLSTPCVLNHLDAGSFDNLTQLKILGIVGCHGLKNIGQGVFGKFLKLDVLEPLGFESTGDNVFEGGVERSTYNLAVFQEHGRHVYRSGLTQIPDMTNFVTLNTNSFGAMTEIDFSRNKIEMIKKGAFKGIKTYKLKLQSNRIKRIENFAFDHAEVIKLQLNKNPLTHIDQFAFKGIKSLSKLDMSHTSITDLPTLGLQEIKELYLQETRTLKQFPSVLSFKKITKARLYYPHHCCAFRIPEKQNPAKWRAYMYEEMQTLIGEHCASVTMKVNHSSSKKVDPQNIITSPTITSTTAIATKTPSHGHFIREKRNFGGLVNQNFSVGGKKSKSSLFDSFVSPIPENSSSTIIITCGPVVRPAPHNYKDVDCTPEPNAMNPCEDVMGYKWLRIFVWIVVLAAILGNIVVFLVLASNRKKMTVPKFLMCNLAFADFLMGIYLLLLASIDIHTLGEYFNYAILWQNEGGCQVAGFLTVFSCELSIFTLTVITLERWYAISHAIHLTKRLKLRQAVAIMASGWVYAGAMANLPLIGVSDYGNVSICLPMKIENAADLAYVISLLVVNGVAFLCICCCYVNMYWQVRHSDSTARSNDATIAKRMAMLVFTNFVCWAPIAFFGLTASAGSPLISITHSKILLVFFYPLNSCANPFLYVIITKQFRKDVIGLFSKYGICTERSKRYKVTTSSKSLTQSRKDSLALHNVIHPINSSVTQVTGSFDGSKNSLKNGNGTPNGTPKESQSPNIACSVEQYRVRDEPCDRRLSIMRGSGAGCEDVKVRFADSKQVKTPPPYIRSASEYVIFFPPTGRNSIHRSNPTYTHQFSSDTYSSSQSGNYTDVTCVSDTASQESPWELREEVQKQTSDTDNFDPIFEEVTEKTPLKYESSNCETDDNGDEEENDDDCVQQTLLKHSTLRNSPAQAQRDRIFIDTKIVSFPTLGNEDGDEDIKVS